LGFETRALPCHVLVVTGDPVLPGAFRIFPMMQRVERPERLDHLALWRLPYPVHRVDRMYLVGEGAPCIRQYRVTHGAMRYPDRLTIGPAQIHDGRTAKPYVVAAQLFQDHRIVTVMPRALQTQMQGEAPA